MYSNQENNFNKRNCMSCIRIYQITGPTGPIGVTGPTGPTGSIQPNPYNLYVLSTAGPNWDGTEENPFQTIEQALAVSQPNGIINVLNGTYPITNQLNLNMPGLIIKGRAGSEILLQSAIVPFLCNSDNTTIERLTMTSDQPYPVEFI